MLICHKYVIKTGNRIVEINVVVYMHLKYLSIGLLPIDEFTET